MLEKLLDSIRYPNYVDPRNCLVFWARPPERIRGIVDGIQNRLLQNAPSMNPINHRTTAANPEGLWLMPLECLHLTVLEVTHSQTQEEISRLVNLMDGKIPEITNFTYSHRARLIRPLISYDAAAIALSFLPTAGEELSRAGGDQADPYTYHHLRRDLHAKCRSADVEVASRYIVPSCHLTIARFVTQSDFAKSEGDGMDQGKMRELVENIEEINRELQATFWPKGLGEWQVGEEKGLVCRKGTVWYGGGQSHHEGLGFFQSDS